MLKRFLLLMIVLNLFLLSVQVNASPRFYLQNPYGILIRVDVASGFQENHPVKKGPRIDEIPSEMKSADFEDKLLKYATAAEKALLNDYYKNDQTGSYKLTVPADDVAVLLQIEQIIRKYNVYVKTVRSIPKSRYENILLKKADAKEGEFLAKYYKEQNNNYALDGINWENINKLIALRNVLLRLNKDNEILNDIDDHGAPMPHNFARVFNPKTKTNFEVHFSWGIKFDNNLVLGFGISMTNFIMPSLEILFKYNFTVENMPFEPYVGGILYGGFIDGFPFGFSVIGGVDIFPRYFHNEYQESNSLFFTAELRLGPLFVSPVYFDSGLNTEGIWKALGCYMEGGFFAGVGYNFRNDR